MNETRRTANIVRHAATVTRTRREAMNGHPSVAVWFTGFSGAGKSTLAHAVEERLYGYGCRTFVLDGDNIRHGLNSNLGFSAGDRQENLRRVGEVAKLFVEAGVITLTALISPFRGDRECVRSLFPPEDFIEIYVRCPLAVCETRDVKGLYARARAGLIPEFTGISSPYEEPLNPELVVDSSLHPPGQCVAQILDLLQRRGVLAELPARSGTRVR